MADHANGLAQLEFIQRRQLSGHLSGQHTNILQAFGLAMRPGVPDAAADAARRLDALCPPLERNQEALERNQEALKRNQEARDYIWHVWEVLFYIAASADVSDQVHFSLLAVLKELEQMTRGQLDANEPSHDQRVWGDLPYIATCFDALYSLPDYETAERTEQFAQNWYKLAIFGARALAARVLGPYQEVISTLESALETDLNARPVAEMMQVEWNVKLACAWLAHGSAMPLLRWAQENMDDGDVEHQTNTFSTGPLYHGPAIVCFERWEFWLHRLDELANQESGLSQETRQTALDTAQTMREAGDALAGQPLVPI